MEIQLNIFFNPAVKVNIAKTKIYAALVLKLNGCPPPLVKRYFNYVSGDTYMTNF